MRSIIAALLGYALVGVLIAGTDQLFAHAIPGFSSMKMPPGWYFAASIVADTIYAFMGGWLCGRISRGNIHAALGLIMIGELAGIASTVYLWNRVPHYYSFCLLITYPPAVLFGAKLRKPVRD